jgi:hypothetical protein
MYCGGLDGFYCTYEDDECADNTDCDKVWKKN